ncbi:unnamed protein product [Blepharisma stoltei]|uniref:Uncharacterized protein n=1 Tax=Blepharisma stoltei TaxID=1481888 RepID=A0AAU9IRI3_9CILI|nr:unnamed protein product [Blepharisma stoltei]
MIFFICLLATVFSQMSHEESITMKIQNKTELPLISLTDKELSHLLDTHADNWLILFYDSGIKTAQNLINTWKRSAHALHQENYMDNIGTVDLRKNYTRNFMRLDLYIYPKAIYINKGFYYNYTGPIDANGVQDLIKKKTYLNHTRIKIPPPATFASLILNAAKQIHEGNPKVLKILGAMMAIILVFPIVFCIKQCQKPEKEKEE